MLSSPGYVGGTILNSGELGIAGPQAVPFVFTVPGNLCDFVFLQSIYTTDATPGLRAPFLGVKDSAGDSMLIIGTGVQNPSTTLRYTWMQGSGFLTGFGIIFHKYLPQGLILQKDWTISVDSLTKGPTDSQVIAFQMGPVT